MNTNVNEEKNELIPVDENDMMLEVQETPQVLIGDDGSQYLMALNGERKMQYSSIDKEKLSFKEKAKFFNLVNGTAKIIKDHVNEQINLRDIYMEVVTVEDMLTKELKHLPRIVLIDDKGEAYTCSSPTFLNKLSQLIGEVGQPKDWESPIPIKFKNVKTKNGFNALVFETMFK